MYDSADGLKYKLIKYGIYIGIPVVVILLIIFIVFAINNSKKKNTFYITLEGDETISIYVGDVYEEPGYSAKDGKGTNVTNRVKVVDNIDSETEGTYEVTYSIEKTSKKRTIIVNKKPIGVIDFKLKGEETIYIDVNDTYSEPGYVALDSIDGEITSNVTVESDLDVTKMGTYKIKYTVINSTLVTATKERTIIVGASNYKITVDPLTYTNKEVKINIEIDANDMLFDHFLLPDSTKVTEKKHSYTVTENGLYEFRFYDRLGTEKIKTVKIININKTEPKGNCSGKYYGGVSVIDIEVSDDIGISKFIIKGKTYDPLPQIVIKGEYSKIDVEIFDKAFNSTTISCSLSKGQ